MKIHELKIWPAFFYHLVNGAKPFELRQTGDREFKVGELVAFREWDPRINRETGEPIGYTGSLAFRAITQIWSDPPIVPAGWALLFLSVLP